MMGFLARLSLRARPALSRAPALLPKGLVMRQPASAFRAEEPAEDEEPAQPLRRAAARTVRRAAEPPPEEAEMQRASEPAPSEEDEQEQPAMATRPAGALHRAEEPGDEEAAQPLQRTTAPVPEPEDEQPAQATRLVRRAEEVPLEEGERPLRQPFQEDVSPGASPLPPDMANEEEPPAMQALRRDTAPFVPPPRHPADRAGAVGPGFDGFGLEPAQPHSANFYGEAGYIPGLPAGFAPPVAEAAGESRTDTPAPQRPQVIIDQVDVLIHEPAAPAAPARPAFDAGRAMRARYLRRL
jgi:hypothetical protein